MSLRDKHTDIDFSKHVLTVTKDTQSTIYDLKQPGTVVHRVRFMNIGGNLVVNGDFGMWVFCREFHPGPKGYVSAGYWCEKLQIGADSGANGRDFDPKKTAGALEDMLHDEDYEWSEKDKESLQELINACSDGCLETDYYFAINESDLNYSRCDLPVRHSYKFWLQVVFDAFNECCRLIEENPEKYKAKNRAEELEADAKMFGYIQALTTEEADGLLILAENPDGPPNNAIECDGCWTDFKTKRFEGSSLKECLITALKARDSHKSTECAARESHITDYEVYPGDEVPFEACDNCSFHEPHYCTLHGKVVKNTNINSCPDFEENPDLNRPLQRSSE